MISIKAKIKGLDKLQPIFLFIETNIEAYI